MKRSLNRLIKQSTTLKNKTPKTIDAFGSGKYSLSDEITFTRTFNKIMEQSIPSLKDSKDSYADTTKSIINESKDLFNQLDQRNQPSKILYQVKKLDNTRIDDYEFNREYLNLEKKTELLSALKPTISLLDRFENDFELMEFLQNTVLRFNKESKKIKKANNRFNDNLTEIIRDTSLTTPNLPLLNQFTLPVIMEKGIHLLATKLYSPQEAITIFEMVKNLNLRTFIYCVTIDIYNEILKIHWNNYKDIASVYHLIDELKLNGIQGNLGTLQCLNKISIEAHKLLNGESDSVNFSLNEQNDENPVYNKKDEDILLLIDQFVHDLNKTHL